MSEITWHRNGLPDEAQQWRRQIEETVSRLIRDGQLSSTDARAAAKERASLASAIARSGLTLAEQTQAVVDARRAPAAPENPQVTTDAYFDEYGVPRAAVSASCDAVTVDTLGKAIEVQFYELYGRHDVAGDVWQKLSEDRDMTTAPNMTYAGLPAGEDWAFKMRAVAGNGVQGEFSGQVLVTLAKDTTPPPQPAPLAGSTRLGQTSLFWSGLTAGGQTQPPDFSHAEVWIDSTSTGAGSAIGRMGVNDTFYPEMQPYNETRWYWLVAVDVAGNRSMASDRTDVTTQPLVDTDVIGQVISGANIVNGSVNAADKIIGNTITGGLIQAFAIDSGKLAANAVTTDKLDAGAVTAVKVAANSITTDKLLVGEFTNLIDDPNFDVGAPAWTGPYYFGSDPTVGKQLVIQSTGDIIDVQNAQKVAVTAGEQYRYHLETYANSFSGNYGIVIFIQLVDGTMSYHLDWRPGNGNYAFDGIVTMPPKASKAWFGITVRNDVTPGLFVLAWKPEFRRMTTGSLIVDGAIDGKTITGALIRTAASGERTEMTTSGIRTLNSAGQELVRIGYGISTGMSVRNPGTGALVPLSDAAFGIVSNVQADALAYSPSGNPNGVFGAFTRHSADNCIVTFTAVSSRYVMEFGQMWTITYDATNYPSAGIFVQPVINGVGASVAGHPVSAGGTDSGRLEGSYSEATMRQKSIDGTYAFATTPGATYELKMNFATYGTRATSGTVPLTLRNRYITATPVFN